MLSLQAQSHTLFLVPAWQAISFDIMGLGSIFLMTLNIMVFIVLRESNLSNLFWIPIQFKTNAFHFLSLMLQIICVGQANLKMFLFMIFSLASPQQKVSNQRKKKKQWIGQLHTLQKITWKCSNVRSQQFHLLVFKTFPTAKALEASLLMVTLMII